MYSKFIDFYNNYVKVYLIQKKKCRRKKRELKESRNYDECLGCLVKGKVNIYIYIYI